MSRGLHASQGGCCASPAAVRPQQPAPTGRVLSPARREARALASMLFATAAAGSLAAVGRALGVSPTIAERWADPEHEAAVTLGDLLAMPPTLAEGVLVAALSHVRARRLGAKLAAPERVLRVAGSASEVVTECVRALRDGRIDPEERRHLRARLRELDQELGPAHAALGEVE